MASRGKAALAPKPSRRGLRPWAKLSKKDIKDLARDIAESFTVKVTLRKSPSKRAKKGTKRNG